MAAKHAGTDREAVALVEVGRTQITRAQVRVLVVAFLTLIFSVPVVQHVREVRGFGAERGRHGSRWPQCYDVFGSLLKASAAFGTRDAAQGQGGWGLVARLFRANSVLLGDIHGYENELSDVSALTQGLLPRTQAILAGLLGAGNEQAYIGRDGWLFYRPGFDYVTGPGILDPQGLGARAQGGSEWRAAPQPDPVLAIMQFRAQLARRGIALIVLPAPDKLSIHPERLSCRNPAPDGPVQNRSYDQFRHELDNPESFFRRYDAFLGPFRSVPRSKARRLWYGPLLETFDNLAPSKGVLLRGGVLVFDPARELVAQKGLTGLPQYLATDTHWRPEAVALVAARLRDFIEKHVALPPVPAPGYRSEMSRVSGVGDVARMLRLPPDQTLYPPEEVALGQVYRGDFAWRPDPRADVLLLGDSYSNVYSLGGMGWGEGAGLPERLSLTLQRPLDVILRNDSGAYATREMLSRDLARGHDRLAGKRLVIWEFAARELAVGDWRTDTTPMTLGRRGERRFLRVAEGDERLVSGTIREVSAAPLPGRVPYRDHVVYVHLADLAAADGRALEADSTLVATYGMRGQAWTPAARFRVGQRVTLRLRNYDEVDRAQKVSAINAALLEGDAALETPCWGDASGAEARSGSASPGQAGRASFLPEAAAVLAVLAVCIGVVRLAERRERRETGSEDPNVKEDV